LELAPVLRGLLGPRPAKSGSTYEADEIRLKPLRVGRNCLPMLLDRATPRGQRTVMSQTNIITRDSWKQILASAVTIFADLEEKGFGSHDVVIGGGTVLMFRFEHRLSKHIDFFMHDVQWLSLLTPRLNDTTAAMVTGYVEQPNGIRLVLPHGDIDFVVAHPVTETKAVATLEFMGRTFLLESTEEILAKTLFYRVAQFQPRDVFDFVVAMELDKESATRALAAAASNRDLLTRRLEQLSKMPPAKLAEGILPISDFSRFMPGMIEAARRYTLMHRQSAVIERDAMTKIFDPAAIAISAIENVSRIPATRADIKRMLATGTGEPSHVMALFSDVDYSSILRLAIAFNISDADLAHAYVNARDTYAASNAEMDEFVLEMNAVATSNSGRSPG
jgi:Nucleotidyl transferase AbiEii toxin, Type IV TA system